MTPDHEMGGGASGEIEALSLTQQTADSDRQQCLLGPNACGVTVNNTAASAGRSPAAQFRSDAPRTFNFIRQ